MHSLSIIIQNNNKQTYSTEDFIRYHFISKIEDNILLFIKAGNILQYFKKDIININDNDIDIFKKYLEENKFNILIKLNIKNRTYLFNKIKDINNKEDFYSEINHFSIKDNKIILYLFNIIISFENYKNYLLSEEDKDDKFIIPLFNEIYPSINIIIFEEINDNIKIKLSQSNTLPDYLKEPNIWDYYIFLYKYNHNYEPLYYRHKILKSNMDRVDAELGLIHYNNIPSLQPILLKIEKLYKDHYLNYRKDINIFNFSDIFNYLISLNNDNFIPKNIYIDNYNKITHIQTNNNIIIPFFPSKININYLNYKYKIILKFNDLPTYEDSIQFYNSYLKDYKIKGLIVEDGFIVNIVFDNYLYIPIKNKKYNKNIKYKIIGKNNIFNIDSILYNNELFSDKRLSFTNQFKYEKFITYSVIQNIISNINKYNNIIHINVSDYREYILNQSYHFKKDKIFHMISLNSNDLFGEVTNIKIKSNKEYPYKAILSIKNNIINDLNNIINHKAYINIHKRELLYPIILSMVDDMCITLSNKDFNNFPINYKNIICFQNTKRKCNYPCKWDDKKCKLIINKNNNNLLKEKIIWKIIDLLLIYKLDKLNSLMNLFIDIDDISSSAKPSEYYFNFEQYFNGYLNILFSFNSMYSRDINIYNEFNENIPNRIQEEKIKYISNIPYFINNIFGKEAFLIHNDNFDLDIISSSINNTLNLNIDSKILKDKIINYLKENKSFIDNYKYYLPNIKSIDDIIQLYQKENYNINPADLILISLIYKIGILFITKLYSKIKNKYDVIINIPEGINQTLYDIPILLFYHKYNNKDKKYYLSNININGNLSLSYNDLLNNKKLKKYIY